MNSYTSLSPRKEEADESAIQAMTEGPKSRRFMSPVIVGALGTFVFVFISVLGLWVSDGVNRKHLDQAALWPKFERSSRILKPDFDYWNLTDIDVALRWRHILPQGHIVVEHPEKYGLKPGIPVSPDAARMIISGTHQIHCLQVIRNAMVTMLTGVHIPGPHAYPGHPDHCFDYLRQSILCKLNLDLEPAVVDFDGKRRWAVGWGAEHQCINWEHVSDFIAEDKQREKDNPDYKKAYDSEPLPPAVMDPIPLCTTIPETPGGDEL